MTRETRNSWPPDLLFVFQERTTLANRTWPDSRPFARGLYWPHGTGDIAGNPAEPEGSMSEQLSREQAWPALPLEAWADTCATLHMWTQIVGKIRLRESAPINHGWHSTLYVTARGLTTSPIPHGHRIFQIDFDFIDHTLRHRGQRWTKRPRAARASDRRGVLSPRDGRARRARHRRPDLREAERGCRSDSVRSR